MVLEVLVSVSGERKMNIRILSKIVVLVGNIIVNLDNFK